MLQVCTCTLRIVKNHNHAASTICQPRGATAHGAESSDDSDGEGGTFPRRQSSNYEEHLNPGLNATTRAQGFTKQESMNYHWKAIQRDILESLRDFKAYRNREPSIRSQKRERLNKTLEIALALALLIILGIIGSFVYSKLYLPIHKKHMLEKAIREHAEAARLRAEKCKDYDWKRACDALGAAGARRQLYTGNADRSNEMEDIFLNSDDPSVTFDENCLRVYRMRLIDNITFPYHSSQLLSMGGNQTMALFIQHGALRNAEGTSEKFCVTF